MTQQPQQMPDEDLNFRYKNRITTLHHPPCYNEVYVNSNFEA